MSVRLRVYLSALAVAASVAVGVAADEAAPIWKAGPLVSRKESLMRSIRFSPRGDDLLTLADCTVNHGETFWLDHRGPTSGELTHSLVEKTGIASWSFAQSADGKTLAFGRSTDDDQGKLHGHVLLWTEQMAAPKTVAGQPGHLRFVEMDGQGKTIVTAGEESAEAQSRTRVQVWDALTGKLTRTLLDTKGILLSLSLSPDGLNAAAGVLAFDEDPHRCVVTVWDTKSGEVRRRFPAENRAFGGVIEFSPDGKLLAISGTPDAGDKPSNLVQVWDPATGKSVKSLSGLSGPALSIAFSNDGSHLAATGGVPRMEQGEWALWEYASGRLNHRVIEGGFVMTSIALAPNGKRLAVSGYRGGTGDIKAPDGLLRVYSRD